MNEFIKNLKAEVKTSSELVKEIEIKERAKLIEEVMRKREEEVWEK